MTDLEINIRETPDDYILIEGPLKTWTTIEGGKTLFHTYRFQEVVHKNDFEARSKELEENPAPMGYPTDV